VRFLVRRDRAGKHFLFSPLKGRLITQLLDEPTRSGLPDSVVLRMPDGAIRTRSESILESLERLGCFWWFVAMVGRIVPLRVRDAVYDYVARTRRRVFGRTHYHCPVVPAHLRDRFVD